MIHQKAQIAGNKRLIIVKTCTNATKFVTKEPNINLKTRLKTPIETDVHLNLDVIESLKRCHINL